MAMNGCWWWFCSTLAAASQGALSPLFWRRVVMGFHVAKQNLAVARLPPTQRSHNGAATTCSGSIPPLAVTMSARNDRYDTRGREDHRRRPPRDREEHYGHRPPPHNNNKRERSRSPDEGKHRLEQERRARMARLRAENEEEEAQLAKLDSPSQQMPQPKEQFVKVNQEELEGLDEEEQMQRLLGFSGGFSTTKGEEVEDNKKSAARGAAGKNKARKYRQYMNRKGGFNRPLEKMD